MGFGSSGNHATGSVAMIFEYHYSGAEGKVSNFCDLLDYKLPVFTRVYFSLIQEEFKWT